MSSLVDVDSLGVDMLDSDEEEENCVHTGVQDVLMEVANIQHNSTVAKFDGKDVPVFIQSGSIFNSLKETTGLLSQQMKSARIISAMCTMVGEYDTGTKFWEDLRPKLAEVRKTSKTLGDRTSDAIATLVGFITSVFSINELVQNSGGILSVCDKKDKIRFAEIAGSQLMTSLSKIRKVEETVGECSDKLDSAIGSLCDVSVVGRKLFEEDVAKERRDLVPLLDEYRSEVAVFSQLESQKNFLEAHKEQLDMRIKLIVTTMNTTDREAIDYERSAAQSMGESATVAEVGTKKRQILRESLEKEVTKTDRKLEQILEDNLESITDTEKDIQESALKAIKSIDFQSSAKEVSKQQKKAIQSFLDSCSASRQEFLKHKEAQTKKALNDYELWRHKACPVCGVVGCSCEIERQESRWKSVFSATDRLISGQDEGEIRAQRNLTSLADMTQQAVRQACEAELDTAKQSTKKKKDIIDEMRNLTISDGVKRSQEIVALKKKRAEEEVSRSLRLQNQDIRDLQDLAAMKMTLGKDLLKNADEKRGLVNDLLKEKQVIEEKHIQVCAIYQTYITNNKLGKLRSLIDQKYSNIERIERLRLNEADRLGLCVGQNAMLEALSVIRYLPDRLEHTRNRAPLRMMLVQVLDLLTPQVVTLEKMPETFHLTFKSIIKQVTHIDQVLTGLSDITKKVVGGTLDWTEEEKDIIRQSYLVKQDHQKLIK